MNKHAILGTVALLLAASLAVAQSDQIVLGQLSTGETVSFVKSPSGEWGIEMKGEGALRIVQPHPAQIEFFSSNAALQLLGAGYRSLEKTAGGVSGRTEINAGGNVVFRIEDEWNLSGVVISVRRKLAVTGTVNGSGFSSGVFLATPPEAGWADMDYLAPGLLYGDPAHDGDTAPGGIRNYRAKRFSMREDYLSAPLFALSFRNGRWAAVLDLEPRGDTTMEETTAPAVKVLVDERYQFGALGAHELPAGGVQFGFWLPGTTNDPSADTRTPGVPGWRRRYHPVRDGVSQTYHVAFRFGREASFRDVTRDAWRWAWQTLKPAPAHTDVEHVRRTLIDHLADRVVTIDGRTGIPFIIDTTTGKVGSTRAAVLAARPGPPAAPPPDPSRWNKAIMGFVGKNIEAADQLLREADRDPGPRGQRMRKLGLGIIDSFIRLVPMSPPAGEGFSLATGQPATSNTGLVMLRGPSEDMRMLMEAYRREKRQGREHPEWLRWCLRFADWLLPQQREDGSFPRSWKMGTGEVSEASGTTSYNPVPLLVMLSQETGQKRYLDAAIRAADFVWTNYGSRGLYAGGAIDNPNITDKEAGMLSLEAFLTLYEAAKEPRWLERAKAAANFTESWIWVWNLPMPLDASDSELHWKRGVPTAGLQGITARVAGHLDMYLDWATPAYAKLYKYTGDAHYLDVARVLLHDTKSMLALPGRTYDMLGPGWQQEHWRMGPDARGFGGHRSWLPWVSTNHLYGITGLEQFDLQLYRELSAKPAPAAK